jgi:lipoprotein-anchoring transpeptidase ErfK/SrfK
MPAFPLDHGPNPARLRRKAISGRSVGGGLPLRIKHRVFAKMRFGLPLIGVLVAVMLAACVPVEQGATPAGSQTDVSQDAATTYASRSDGRFRIPEIPLDQFPAPLRRQIVTYPSKLPPGSVVIHTGKRLLYFVTGKNKAIRYGISVGREGFEWSGEAQVSRVANWPRWTPPPEMIARNRKYAKWKDGLEGGPTNPLGARAIYLTTNGRDYGYRIHGTPDWESIGKNASSGCIRMTHQDVIDLAARIKPGAKVVVLKPDGSPSPKLSLPATATFSRKSATKAKAAEDPVEAEEVAADTSVPTTSPEPEAAAATPLAKPAPPAQTAKPASPVVSAVAAAAANAGGSPATLFIQVPANP